MSHTKRKHAATCPRSSGDELELNITNAIPCTCGTLAARQATRERERAMRKLAKEGKRAEESDGLAQHLCGCASCRAKVREVVRTCEAVRWAAQS